MTLKFNQSPGIQIHIIADDGMCSDTSIFYVNLSDIDSDGDGVTDYNEMNDGTNQNDDCSFISFNITEAVSSFQIVIMTE